MIHMSILTISYVIYVTHILCHYMQFDHSLMVTHVIRFSTVHMYKTAAFPANSSLLFYIAE